MIKEVNFFREQKGHKESWGKSWQEIHDCNTVGDARRKFASSYGEKLSFIYDNEK